MAKRLQSDNAEKVRPNALSPDERQDRLSEAIAAQLELDRKRDTFNAKLREDKNENVLSIVRDVLGMPTSTFSIFVRAAKLKANEENAVAWEDFQTHILEGVAALQIGAQLDLFADTGGKNKGKAKGKAKAAATPKLAASRGRRKPAEKKADAKTERPTPTSETTKDTVAQAREKGEAAGSMGQDLDQNPYKPGSKHRQGYAAGWHKAQGAIAAQIGKTDSDETATKH
jgi:hypothetical protein